MESKFPEGFLWGTATSSHQIEGDNFFNDWWAWEQAGKNKPSGKACDSYNRYEEDFDFIEKMNNNAHRLSIEWSRIEPKENEFNNDAVEHYKKVFAALKKRKIKIMLTLHHFTNPEWLSKKGGWLNSKTPIYFERFVRFIAENFKDDIDLWITINEPMIYAMQSHYNGIFPPGKKSLFAFRKVLKNLIQAHRLGYKALHQIIPNAKAGFAQNPVCFSAWPKKSITSAILIPRLKAFWNHYFYKKTKGCHDFVGINYYFHFRIKFSIFGIKAFKPHELNLSSIEPEPFFKTLVEFKKYNLPIHITENGTATENEEERITFLISYLNSVRKAIEKGANIGGYFYWSLLDNFEWESGIGPRFGLVKVDFKNFRRSLTPAGEIYSQTAQQNGISKFNEFIKKE
jgi:beta-glucosidase